ncbi:MAG TPA: hypothetical protein VEC35_01940 [Noviherbaspirillum sp.]|nr:hypothetical protein [Noviherbaspirillum sp.]
MLYLNSFPSGAIALAALAAMACPAQGSDFAVEGEQAEVSLPDVPSVADAEHSNSPSISNRIRAEATYFQVAAVRTGAAGFLSSALNEAQAAQDIYPAAGLAEPGAGRIEVSRAFGNAALSLGSHASMRTFQVGGAYMIAPKLAIAGQAAYGIVPVERSGDNLAAGIASARANAFSFALVATDRVRRGDRLSVSLSQPMQSYSGRIVMDMLPRSGGSASRERLVFSMVPIGREMRAQLNYQMPVGQGATFGMTLMARRNPNNLMDERVETRVIVRYVKSF